MNKVKFKYTKVFQKNYQAFKDNNIRFIINQGGSRCHSKGTLIRMYDGSLKSVEDIIIGDKVANFDGKGYSTVIDLDNGTTDLYKITQGKGDSYFVTNNHKLALKQVRPKYKKTYPNDEKNPYGYGRKPVMKPIDYDKDKIHFFTAEEWSKVSGKIKKRFSGFKNTFLELPKNDLKINPYYLGLWLGDGSSNFGGSISNIDKEIITYLENFSESNNLLLNFDDKCTYRITHQEKGKQTKLSKSFYDSNLIKNKHIPKEYIYSSYKDRLKLLAGLIDSDGYLSKRNTLIITQKNKTIIDGIKELLDISGFYTRGIRESIATMKRANGSTYKCKVYTLEINHPNFVDLNKYIKVKRKRVNKNVNDSMFNTKIESTYIGKGEYFGFTLDSEQPLYKLKDGTITHNSSKTYSIIQLLIIEALSKENQQITIVRRGERVLKRTVFKDFKEVLLNVGLWQEANWNKGELEYHFGNGSIISFVSLDNPQKLRGLKHNLVYFNEANEATDEEFIQINIRTNGKIFLDWNPSEEENYIYDLIRRPEGIMIHSTYKDNNTLSKAQIKEIEALIDKDENLYRVYTLGLPPIKRETVFTNWELGKFPTDVPFIYGMDFGYNDPNVIVQIYKDDDKIYVKQVIYESYLDPNELIELMHHKQIRKDKVIQADHKPDMHKLIEKEGFLIENAVKNIDKRITHLRRFKIIIDPDSKDIIKEFKNYSYKKTNGVITDIPVDKYNHAIDSIGYAFMEYIEENETSFFVI